MLLDRGDAENLKSVVSVDGGPHVPEIWQF